MGEALSQLCIGGLASDLDDLEKALRAHRHGEGSAPRRRRIPSTFPSVHWAPRDIADDRDAWLAWADELHQSGQFTGYRTKPWALEVFSYAPRHDIEEALPKLSRAFPSLRFTLDWDEGDEPCGRCVAYAGEVTAFEILPWDGNSYIPPGEEPSTKQTVGGLGYFVDETEDPPDNWAPFSRQRLVINGPRETIDAIVQRLRSKAKDDLEWLVLLHRLVRRLEFMPAPVARRVLNSRNAWLRQKLARVPSLGVVRRIDRNAVAIEWRATRAPREDVVRKLALAMPHCGVRYEWEQVHAKRTGRIELHGAEEIYRGEMPLREFICCPRPGAKRYFVGLISG